MRAPAKTIGRARTLRKDMSLPEVVLWNCLRGSRLAGLRFRRQHAVGPYVLDFYCPAIGLAIEVDGGHHDLHEQMRHDAHRDGWLAERGIRIFRTAATDVLDDHALEGILKLLAQVAVGAEIPPFYRTRSIVRPAPPPPPPAVPLPRERGRIEVVDGRDVGSSPAERGRGTAGGGGGGEHPTLTAEEEIS